MAEPSSFLPLNAAHNCPKVVRCGAEGGEGRAPPPPSGEQLPGSEGAGSEADE